MLYRARPFPPIHRVMRWLLVWAVCSAWAQNNPATKAALEKQRAGVVVQREAARKQAELNGPSPLQRTLAPSAAAPPCDPMPESDSTALIESTAKARNVEAQLLRAVVEQESSFYPCAVSVHGAKGLMQLMQPAMDEFGVRDPFDAKQNLDAGARYLKQLLDQYKGDLKRALSAYRIGPSEVDKASGIPDIPEVRSYVEAILGRLATPPAPPQTPMPKPIGN
jgi:soluble lytic murein transglycosylase-like protein